MLVVEDEFTRECLALEVGGNGFNGDRVAEVLTELFVIRGVPNAIRSDNGSEFVGAVARHARRQRAKGGSENSCIKRPSRHKDDVWAMDFIFDSTASGGTRWLS